MPRILVRKGKHVTQHEGGQLRVHVDQRIVRVNQRDEGIEQRLDGENMHLVEALDEPKDCLVEHENEVFQLLGFLPLFCFTLLAAVEDKVLLARLQEHFDEALRILGASERNFGVVVVPIDEDAPDDLQDLRLYSSPLLIHLPYLPLAQYLRLALDVELLRWLRLTEPALLVLLLEVLVFICVVEKLVQLQGAEIAAHLGLSRRPSALGRVHAMATRLHQPSVP